MAWRNLHWAAGFTAEQPKAKWYKGLRNQDLAELAQKLDHQWPGLCHSWSLANVGKPMSEYPKNRLSSASSETRGKTCGSSTKIGTWHSGDSPKAKNHCSGAYKLSLVRCSWRSYSTSSAKSRKLWSATMWWDVMGRYQGLNLKDRLVKSCFVWVSPWEPMTRNFHLLQTQWPAQVRYESWSRRHCCTWHANVLQVATETGTIQLLEPL